MAEKDFGLIHDRFSWDVEIDASRAQTVHGCQVFHASADSDPDPGPPEVLARSSSLSSYTRTFAAGTGENGLHSHDDDAIWMVLDGRAQFFAPADRLLGDLGEHGAVLVPAGTSYRFVCQGRTTLMRVAARAAG
jgi:mannose-6-phosphate isomerase-like protein (cupin superfamily)